MAENQTKRQMMKAKQLIDQKKYADARKLLVSVNHPTAKQWVDKIDAMQPAKKQSSGTNPLVVLLFVVAMIVSALIGAVVSSVIIPSSASPSIAGNSNGSLTMDEYLGIIDTCTNAVDAAMPRYIMADNFFNLMGAVDVDYVAIDLHSLVVNTAMNRLALEVCLYGDDGWRDSAARIYTNVSEFEYPYMYSPSGS